MRISLKRRRAIYAAYGGVCQYCGIAGATHIDHIRPRFLGGSDDLENLILACSNCNTRKAYNPLLEPLEAKMLALAAATRQTILDYERDSIPAAARTSGGPRTLVTVMMTKSQRAAVKRWRFENQIASESEAVRELLRRGLATHF